jgi:hypothetical protein
MKIANLIILGGVVATVGTILYATTSGAVVTPAPRRRAAKPAPEPEEDDAAPVDDGDKDDEVVVDDGDDEVVVDEGGEDEAEPDDGVPEGGVGSGQLPGTVDCDGELEAFQAYVDSDGSHFLTLLDGVFPLAGSLTTVSVENYEGVWVITQLENASQLRRLAQAFDPMTFLDGVFAELEPFAPPVAGAPAKSWQGTTIELEIANLQRPPGSTGYRVAAVIEGEYVPVNVRTCTGDLADAPCSGDLPQHAVVMDSAGVAVFVVDLGEDGQRLLEIDRPLRLGVQKITNVRNPDQIFGLSSAGTAADFVEVSTAIDPATFLGGVLEPLFDQVRASAPNGAYPVELVPLAGPAAARAGSVVGVMPLQGGTVVGVPVLYCSGTF